jgi:hypothetical protein
MADKTTWVKIRDERQLSWHALRAFTADELEAMGARLGSIGTRDGRWITSIPCPTVDDLPLGDHSCETCLRLLKWDEEQGA